METILSLYVADYIINNSLTPKHDIKIVAFTGEELGMRGAKDYIRKYVDGPNGEDIQYFFNPGNFGHSDRTLPDGRKIPFNISISGDTNFNDSIRAIVEAFRYEEATGIPVGYPDEFGAEDSWAFNLRGYGEGLTQFGRGPYREYHRGNELHTAGDNMSVLDDNLSEIECSLFTTISLHFLIEHERDLDLYECSLADSDNDSLNDTVNVTVNLTAAIPTWGYVNLSLEDSQGLCVFKKTSEWLAFNQTTNQTYSSFIQLPPNATSGNYKLNITLHNFINDTVEDNCSVVVELYPLSHPLADFSSQRVSQSKQVNFTDTSYVPPGLHITNWSWDFGDGNTSTDRNPQHTYAYAGRMYDVNLTIKTNDSQINTTIRSIALPAYGPSAQCQDAGEWHYVDESFNLETQCSDYDGTITNYEYDWGDGTTTTTSSSTVPSHSYSEGGFYTVSLKVTDDDNISTTDYTTINVADIYIDDSFSRDSPSRGWWRTIDDGLQNASAGDILYIHNGSYSEQLSVSLDNLTLIGESVGNVVLDYSSGSVLTINANNSTLSTFTVNNSITGILLDSGYNTALMNLSLTNNTYGVRVDDDPFYSFVSNSTFYNNTYGAHLSTSSYVILGSGEITEEVSLGFMRNAYGIFLDRCDQISINNCHINGTIPGASPPQSHGIYMDDSSNTTVSFCTIHNATNYAVYMDDGVNNTVSISVFHNNTRGVYLSGTDNIVAGNCLCNNTESGVSVLTGSSDNVIVYNDFIDNGGVSFPQASDYGSSASSRHLDGGHFIGNSTSEGNYWSDCTGNDTDGDLIVDSMDKAIGGIWKIYDEYPLVTRYGW